MLHPFVNVGMVPNKMLHSLVKGVPLLLLLLVVGDQKRCGAFHHPFSSPSSSFPPRGLLQMTTTVSNNINGKGDNIAPSVVESVTGWLTKESLQQLYPQPLLKQTLEELNGNKEFLEQNRPTFEKYWDKIEESIRKEKRSLRSLLGEKTVNSLLIRIEAFDIYEPTTVRAFLQAPAFEEMLGGILYEGIFLFIQKADIIGNIIDKIPGITISYPNSSLSHRNTSPSYPFFSPSFIIYNHTLSVLGPVRKVVINEFKNQLDKTVGQQVKSFLSSFNRIAVQRMIEYLLNPKNRGSLQKANRAVAQSLFDRPLSSLSPGIETTLILRERIWSVIINAPPSEIVLLFDSMYDRVSTKTLDDFGDAQQLLDAVPTARKVLEDNIARFFDTTEGNNLLKDMALAALNDD